MRDKIKGTVDKIKGLDKVEDKRKRVKIVTLSPTMVEDPRFNPKYHWKSIVESCA